MKRRQFIRTTGLGTTFAMMGLPAMAASMDEENSTWYDRPMRWAQLTSGGE